jgi:hypothetical protein
MDQSEAERTTLGDILERYKHEITPKKKSAEIESIRINKFIRDEPIAKFKATALNGSCEVWRHCA